MVEVEEAVVVRRGRLVLRGAALSVAQGELIGVFGPNGAGKTTLLLLISGLLRCASGRVRVLGEELTPAAARRIRTLTGYVPQTLRIDARLPASAREVALMGRYGRLGLLRRPGSQDHAAVRRAMERTGVWHLADRPFGQLSGGEQQRVMIARALAQEPRLLLLDEPTASLDWEAQRGLPQLIRAAHDECALTTIVVSHDAASLVGLCDRIILMRGGKIIGESAPEDFGPAQGAMDFLAAQGC